MARSGQAVRRDRAINPHPVLSFFWFEVSSQATTPAVALVEVRLGLGALVFLPFLWPYRKQFTAVQWWYLAGIGAINSAIHFALYAWAAQCAPAGTYYRIIYRIGAARIDGNVSDSLVRCDRGLAYPRRTTHHHHGYCGHIYPRRRGVESATHMLMAVGTVWLRFKEPDCIQSPQ